MFEERLDAHFELSHVAVGIHCERWDAALVGELLDRLPFDEVRRAERQRRVDYNLRAGFWVEVFDDVEARPRPPSARLRRGSVGAGNSDLFNYITLFYC